MLATAATQPFQPWTIFWPAIAGTVVLGSVMIFGLWYERRERLRRFRSPQTEKLLRPAGHSLSLELDRAFEKAVADLWWGLCLCGIGCGFIQPAVWTLFLLRAPPWQGVVSIILVPTLLFAGVYKAFRVIRGAVKAREF